MSHTPQQGPAVPRASKRRARASSVDPDPVVAKYTAVVSLGVERSEVVITDPAASEEARRQLLRDTGHATWPPRVVASRATRETAGEAPSQEVVQELAQASIERLALARLKALFDFGAQLEDEERDQLERLIEARWRSLARHRAQRATGASSPNYERVLVEAVGRASGAASWRFSRSSKGHAPLPLPDETPECRPELDLYIQNHVRADLNRLLRGTT